MQKHAWSVQPPWTSKSGPQREAHAGRPEVKGTRAPSGDATAPAGPVCETADAKDMRLLANRTRVAEKRMVADVPE